MPFFLANSFLAILMLINRKPVQRNGISEKRVFHYWPTITKVLAFGYPSPNPTLSKKGEG